MARSQSKRPLPCRRPVPPSATAPGKAGRCAAVRSRQSMLVRQRFSSRPARIDSRTEASAFSLVIVGARVRLGSPRLGSPTCTASTTVGPCLMIPSVLSVNCKGCRLRSSASLSAIAACVGSGTGRFMATSRSRASSTCGAIGYRVITCRRPAAARSRYIARSRSLIAPGRFGAT